MSKVYGIEFQKVLLLVRLVMFHLEYICCVPLETSIMRTLCTCTSDVVWSLCTSVYLYISDVVGVCNVHYVPHQTLLESVMYITYHIRRRWSLYVRLRICTSDVVGVCVHTFALDVVWSLCICMHVYYTLFGVYYILHLVVVVYVDVVESVYYSCSMFASVCSSCLVLCMDVT